MHEPRKALGYPLYAVTIFLSAFLLFAIQPIAAKHLLPFFGGSSSVWATSLLFFTTILFAGYSYVMVLTRYRQHTQILIHVGIILAAGLYTIGAVLLWGSIYPPLESLSDSTIPPMLRVLIALSLSIGIPYFLLSTTGPLLQFWYGTHVHHEPYKLYALSNAGSLLALLSYPFLIEPYFSLGTEEAAWIVLFLMYSVLIGGIALTVQQLPPRTREQHKTVSGYSALRAMTWAGYAALPACMLVAVTTVLTQLISPVPLLWIVPLALYLLTYILAFSDFRYRTYLPLFTLIAAIAAYIYTPATPREIVPETAAYLSLLFFASLMCHARLYTLRPETSSLPFFYFCTSLGGVIGTLFASIIAPLVFNNYFEFPLALAVTAALSIYLMPRGVYPLAMPESWIRAVTLITPFGAALLFTNIVTADVSPNILASRNFYGAVQIQFEETRTMLQHGTTMHGLQATEREWSYVPTTYYTGGSGLARAIRSAQERAGTGPIRVGIVGLGSGTAATYCRDGDTYTFYEIDPRIKDIATQYFSYLARCEGSSVRIGDGRLLLQEESRTSETGYDILAIDAFTDDAIPAHLLTKEAVALYMSRTRSQQSIVAIHTSNRFLALAPMLLSITKELGLSAMIVNDNGEGGYLGSASQWVLLSRDAIVFSDTAFTGVLPWFPPEEFPAPWTDTYTSLFSVLALPDFMLPNRSRE